MRVRAYPETEDPRGTACSPTSRHDLQPEKKCKKTFS